MQYEDNSNIRLFKKWNYKILAIISSIVDNKWVKPVALKIGVI